MRKGILDGTITSAISDTGATSTAGKPGDPFDEIGQPSSKTFKLPDGRLKKAQETVTLQHPL